MRQVISDTKRRKKKGVLFQTHSVVICCSSTNWERQWPAAGLTLIQLLHLQKLHRILSCILPENVGEKMFLCILPNGGFQLYTQIHKAFHPLRQDRFYISRNISVHQYSHFRKLVLSKNITNTRQICMGINLIIRLIRNN